jgi:peroxiredoxin
MMKATMRFILIILTFAFLTAEAPSPWSIDELMGKRAPEFTLKDLNDKTISLSSLKGNVVLINFWATWCPPCRAEMSSLNNLYREYKNNGLSVIAVSTDRSISSVKDFLSKKQLELPVLMDSDSKVSRQFKVFSLPTSFLLDKNGVIVQKFLGEEEWDSPEMKKKIRELLAVP